MARSIVLVFTLIIGVVPQLTSAQEDASLRSGVVKVMSIHEGTRRVGTGFVVKTEGSNVFIVTAAHVIEGDPTPKIELFTQQNMTVNAAVLKQDLRYDLALLKVESRQRPMVLELESSPMPRVGDEVITIGFPRSGGAWLLSRADLSGRDGADLVLSGGAIDEGNSGGPVIKGGKVVGVVHAVQGKFAKAMPVSVVTGMLEGWGLTLTADSGKPLGEEPRSSANAPTGSIDYSNFEQVKKAAERGDPKAMDVLGDMYAKGQGVRENYAEAAKWYRRSADAGYPEAFTSMGTLSLVKAMGLAGNDESAVRFARDESKKPEFVSLMSSLVRFPEKMQIRNHQEINESVKWFRKGAEQGHDPNAQFMLALLTGGGVGVQKDPVRAAELMRLAATKEPVAQALMGIYYVTGRGVEQDSVEGARRLREAAEKEVPTAYSALGILYAEGLGVVKDYTEARKWLRKGAQYNDPDAKGYLSMLHLLGWGGPPDVRQAYQLAREAAEQGNQFGQFALGVMFSSGNGVPQDLEEGLKWLRASARQGNTAAQEILRQNGQDW